jgi:PHD-finger
MELFPCQTCDNCYHAECMTPTLEPDEVPGFWFCPHCVDRELHIPPDSPTTHYFTPVSPALPFPSPSSPASSRTQANSISISTPRPLNEVSHKRAADRSNSEEQFRSGQPQVIPAQNTKAQASSQMPEARSVKELPPKSSTGRPRRSYSPPRKKSKYSAFSVDVDKALTVIHKELEKAAQIGRAEGGLQDKIHALEQQLKLKDGQIQLGVKELEFSKRKHGESSLLEAENKQLKEQNAKLVSLVEKKDAELRDWRLKLKSMIGNDLE